jgi:hypothetical protein
MIRNFTCPAARLWQVSMTIWVDAWQMQCCGEPFRIGSTVAWTLRDASPDWLETVLGAEAARAVDAAEEHHGGVPEDTEPVSGTVTRISAVHCRYAPQPDGDPRALHPVPGSAVLTDLKSANGWTADRGDERFAGYIVQLAEDRGDGDRSDRP